MYPLTETCMGWIFQLRSHKNICYLLPTPTQNINVLFRSGPQNLQVYLDFIQYVHEISMK